MDNGKQSMAEQIAQVASEFQFQRTGHAPRSVNVALNADTLVITLNEALTPAEIDLAKTSEGAAQVQEYHQRLFESSAEALRLKIKRITGVAVNEAAAEIESETGAVVHAFASGTVVQVFLLDRSIPTESWNGSSPMTFN